MTGECSYEAVIRLKGATCAFPRPVVTSHLFTPRPNTRPDKSLAVAFLIDTPKRLETPVIHRKQNSDPISNRYKNAPLPVTFKPPRQLRRMKRKRWVLERETLLALVSSLCCAALLVSFARYEILAKALHHKNSRATDAMEPMEPTPQSSEPYAIKTDELTRKFGEMTAVDALNLRVSSGKIFGLLGPNGAGKSTTIKMLTTLLEPTSGSASVAGFDIVRAPAQVRRHIGYVPQLLSADGGLTGFENLMLSAKLYGMNRAERKVRIAEALEFMGLTESGQRVVKTYSGGMIRRLELAQAMLHRPTVMFLDEPTIGLDPVARHAVWDRLEDLQRESQMTVLITTHDMDEADELCDELAILHQGKVAAVGEPDALKATVGPDATLDDVFVHFSGGSIQEGGSYRDVRQARRTASRLG